MYESVLATTNPPDITDRAKLASGFLAIRSATLQLISPLTIEDMAVQSMPDASPVKWHAAHTSWFFDYFVLRRFGLDWSKPVDTYDLLFNSYYNTIGPQHCRARRGVMSHPSLDDVLQYRAAVDDAISRLLENSVPLEAIEALEIGMQHEMQHQELILTDIKHALSSNPLLPAPYAHERNTPSPCIEQPLTEWWTCQAGIRRIGSDADSEFAFDNERPRHRVFVEAFKISKRTVTNGEFRAFIEDGGYERPELWLSLGWASVQENGWRCPLYWYQDDSVWREYTLHRGAGELHDNDPVCHVSYYEADAYARWADARLPTEAEWETAAADLPSDGVVADEYRYHPAPVDPREPHPSRFFGDVWEWTSSSYAPYPGYNPPAGALGEYNGKFMCNQYVLKGGSCATPRPQVRLTYRNFFPPNARWQFAGIRLARSVSTDAGVTRSDPACADTLAGPTPPSPNVHDRAMARECAITLSERPKRLPTRFLYDEKGSELFERITELPEYSLTRDEEAVYEQHIDEIAEAIGSGAWIIELGVGDGRKTRRLLASLKEPAGYTSLDISSHALSASTAMLSQHFPELDIRPIMADFANDVDISDIPSGVRRVAFFPGSTIGNFDADESRRLMRRIAQWVGPTGGLLLGADLVRSEDELVRAYSDPTGITAEFNLNLLDHLNREAGADFDRSLWRHRAQWASKRSRMESHLVSLQPQRIKIGDQAFEFDTNEEILTEVSVKYTVESLCSAAQPFVCRDTWVDPCRRFVVAYMEVPASHV